jgi:hypothetical protein
VSVRTEVAAFAALGPLPDSAADEAAIAIHEAALRRIVKPLSDDEASLLLHMFGVDECYGLAWMLLHLIESAPHGAPITSAPSEADNEWLRRLWRRAHR